MDRVKKQIHYWCRDVEEGHIAGQKIGVAVLDTGLSVHPDFGNRVLAFQDCVNGRQGMYDDSGHGTHVSGILAGNGRMSRGRYCGIAPKAELIAVKVLDGSGEGNVDQILAGIEWVLKYQKRYRIRVVNLSLGGHQNLEERKEAALVHGVERLWDQGMTVVVSAGNYGPGEGTVAVPGNSRKVITVGAMRETGGREGCSGAGPTEQCVVKPDLLAPGFRIISCNSQYQVTGRPYVEKSGASMATPMAAGAAALFHSKYPDSTNVEVKLRFRETCEKMQGQDENRQGWGCLRIDQFLA